MEPRWPGVESVASLEVRKCREQCQTMVSVVNVPLGVFLILESGCGAADISASSVTQHWRE